VNITEKIHLDKEGLMKEGPITIVAFGDSITHGWVNELNYETVYWNRLRKKILQVKDYVPINVINAGIGGVTAKSSLARMERQVFSHHPDLVIICFGLNDVNGSMEEYLDSLEKIFDKCNQAHVQSIFMTPNMLNTYVAKDTAEQYLEYAASTAEFQNSGRMDRYMEAACILAEKKEIKVCDCYSMWKELSKTQDTTLLLGNRINHPTEEMHELFAQSLFELIFQDIPEVFGKTCDGMWIKKE